MKYDIILTAALLTAMLASCAKDQIAEKEMVARPQVTLSGTIVGNPGTKTYMGDENTGGKYYPVYWSTGDEIAVFSGKSAGVFTLTEIDSSDDAKATFTGDAGDTPVKYDGTDVFPAAYPAADAFAKVNADALLVGSYLPNQQPYKEGTFDDDVFPMAGISTDGKNFTFYNLCGVIQIPVVGALADLSIRSVYLTGNKGEVIAGGVGMRFDSATGEIFSADEDSKDYGKEISTYGDEAYTRTIVNLGSLTLDTATPKYINIAVIPQTFEEGFTVEFVDAENLGRVSYKLSSPITIKRSVLTRLKQITYGQPEPGQVANSYVYSDAGYYLMPAYAMGNRMDVKLPTEGRNLAADLLWSELLQDGVTTNTTDRDDILPALTNIEYITDPNGYGMLQFKLNIDPKTSEPYRGNAAIALFDTDTYEVIWSWHIWMCEPVCDVITGGTCADGNYDYILPTGDEVHYAAEASSGKLIIMDRNLGAISANPADGWKTYGLYYQNGRRDPFIGGHWDGSSAAGATRTTFSSPKDNLDVRHDETGAFSVGTSTTAPVWYNKKLAPRGWFYLNKYQDVSTALRNPMTFSIGCNINNGQWTLYSETDNQEWLDPNAGSGGKKKGGSSSSTGKHGSTGLSDGGHEAYWNRTKTIMDPCPVGYSVLGERGGLFINGDSKTLIFEDAGGSHTEHGIYGMKTTFVYNSQTYETWWPAAGVRAIDGILSDVGYRGMYYHYDHISADHGGHGSGFNAGGQWKAGITTNHAASIRCVREKQFDSSGNPTIPLNTGTAAPTE